MRIRGVGIAIAMCAVLTLLVGAMVRLASTRDRTVRSREQRSRPPPCRSMLPRRGVKGSSWPPTQAPWSGRSAARERGRRRQHSGKAQLKYPNLGSHLNNLVVRVEEGAASTRDAEGGAGVQGDGSVAVTVHVSGNVEDVLGFLDHNGGDPRNVGEDYIEAYVPVALLERLSGQPGVLRVREIIRPQEDR